MARFAWKASLIAALVLLSFSAVAAKTTVPKCTKTFNVEINVAGGKAVVEPSKNVVFLHGGQCVHWYVGAPAGKKSQYRVDQVRVLRNSHLKATREGSATGIERVRLLPQIATRPQVGTNVPPANCCDFCSCSWSACPNLAASCAGVFEAQVGLVDPGDNHMMIDIPTIVVNCTQPCRPKLWKLLEDYQHDAKDCDPAKGCNPGNLRKDFLEALRSEIKMP